MHVFILLLRILTLSRRIPTDSVILETLSRSPSTTSNVNTRVNRVQELIDGVIDE